MANGSAHEGARAAADACKAASFARLERMESLARRLAAHTDSCAELAIDDEPVRDLLFDDAAVSIGDYDRLPQREQRALREAALARCADVAEGGAGRMVHWAAARESRAAERRCRAVYEGATSAAVLRKVLEREAEAHARLGELCALEFIARRTFF